MHAYLKQVFDSEYTHKTQYVSTTANIITQIVPTYKANLKFFNPSSIKIHIATTILDIITILKYTFLVLLKNDLYLKNNK